MGCPSRVFQLFGLRGVAPHAVHDSGVQTRSCLQAPILLRHSCSQAELDGLVKPSRIRCSQMLTMWLGETKSPGWNPCQEFVLIRW